jgi:hypothetical protein
VRATVALSRRALRTRGGGALGLGGPRLRLRLLLRRRAIAAGARRIGPRITRRLLLGTRIAGHLHRLLLRAGIARLLRLLGATIARLLLRLLRAGSARLLRLLWLLRAGSARLLWLLWLLLLLLLLLLLRARIARLLLRTRVGGRPTRGRAAHFLAAPRIHGNLNRRRRRRRHARRRLGAPGGTACRRR